MKFLNVLVFSTIGSVADAFSLRMQQGNPSYRSTSIPLSSVDYDTREASTGSPYLSSLGDNENKPTQEIFEDIDQVTVQGGSLRTCSFAESVCRVGVFLKTGGRPLNANIDLWQGPDNTPQKMTVYLEDGSKRPFRAIVETPGSSNAVSIRNTAQLEYPLVAGMDLDMSGTSNPPSVSTDYRIVQGGAVYTLPFAPAVQSIRVSLKTDGRPLNARVELLQGPNNNKQVMEVYTEDGLERPFNVIVDAPGVGNVVRIVNTATVEFPLSAALEPFIIDESRIDSAGPGMTWR